MGFLLQVGAENIMWILVQEPVVEVIGDNQITTVLMTVLLYFISNLNSSWNFTAIPLITSSFPITNVAKLEK